MHSDIVSKWTHKLKYALFVYGIAYPNKFDDQAITISPGAYDGSEDSIIPIFASNDYSDPESIIGAGKLVIEDGIGYLYVSKQTKHNLEPFFRGTAKGMGSYVNQVEFDDRPEGRFATHGVVQAAFLDVSDLNEQMKQLRRWDNA